MVRPTFFKRIAALVAMALLLAQLAVAAHACPVAASGAGLPWHGEATAAPTPDCHEPSAAIDPTAKSVCAEHCKQGDQSDRANVALAVPPALLNPLYAMPAVPVAVRQPQLARTWLSALVAASPPHAIAHCVLRI